MNGILQDLSAPALAAALENNLYALFDTMIAQLSADVDSRQELVRYSNTGILNPMFNSVMRVKTTPEAMDRVIQETIAYYQTRQTPFWFWWIGPSSQPANMGDILEAHGLLPYEVDAPGMAVNLQALKTDGNTPDDFHISEVKGEPDLDIWVQTIMAGMEMPEFAAQSWKQASLRLGVDRLPWRMYIGWLGEKPVAVSMSFCGAGVVGVMAVGVIPEARQQGIGGAITVKPLLDAREQGYRVGVLFSTEMGFPVYKRLGFEPVGTISRYLWRNS